MRNVSILTILKLLPLSLLAAYLSSRALVVTFSQGYLDGVVLILIVCGLVFLSGIVGIGSSFFKKRLYSSYDLGIVFFAITFFITVAFSTVYE
jgi:hypothetical protein